MFLLKHIDDLANKNICQITRSKIFLFSGKRKQDPQKKFKIFLQSSCKFYTKRIIFVSRK